MQAVQVSIPNEVDPPPVSLPGDNLRGQRPWRPKAAKAIAGAAWTIEAVKQPKAQKGFEVLPRRWTVEHTIAWIDRRRRLRRISKFSTAPPSPSPASPP